jgi:hypothetical protein
MQNKGLKSLLIAAVAVIIVLGIKLFIQSNASEKPVGNKASAIIDEAKTEAKVLARSVDQKGYAKTTLERKKAIIGNGDISKLPVSQSVVDSLRLDNLDKDKKLQQASYLNATLHAEKLRAVKQIDSLKGTRYTYSDDFASVGFTPDSLGGKFDLDYKIKLIRHDYIKRKNIFSPYINYTDILSPDKRITINGLQSLSIASPARGRFGVGLQGGYYFDPITRQFKPAVGVGITYNLIQF